MISEVTKKDLSEILEIINNSLVKNSDVIIPKYKVFIQKSGFFVSSTPFKEKDIVEMFNSSSFFLINKEEKGINGFICVENDVDVDFKDKGNCFWYQKRFSNLYYEKPRAEMSYICVTDDAKGKGIASSLLNNAVNILKKRKIKYLFSSIVISPITNIPSLLFHEMVGFRRVAISHPKKRYGLKDCQCFLYALKI